MNKIIVKDIIKTENASIDILGTLVKNEIDFKKPVTLDFDGIVYATTAFFNVILAGYINSVKNIEQFSELFSLVNHNKGVELAFNDSYDLLYKRLRK